MKNILIILVPALIFGGCNQKQTSPSTDQVHLKAVEELSYSEIVNPVMSDNGEPFEYHGEAMIVEAMADVLLEATKKPCEQKDCGQQYGIKNIGERTIKVLSYTTFQVGLLDSYAARYFTLKKGEEAIIGCSSFCYNGKKYTFSHKIIGAEYAGTNTGGAQ